MAEPWCSLPWAAPGPQDWDLTHRHAEVICVQKAEVFDTTVHKSFQRVPICSISFTEAILICSAWLTGELYDFDNIIFISGCCLIGGRSGRVLVPYCMAAIQGQNPHLFPGVSGGFGGPGSQSLALCAPRRHVPPAWVAPALSWCSRADIPATCLRVRGFSCGSPS